MDDDVCCNVRIALQCMCISDLLTHVTGNKKKVLQIIKYTY